MTTGSRPTIRPRLWVTVDQGRRYMARLRGLLGDGTDLSKAWPSVLEALDYRRRHVDNYVRKLYGMTVRSGPFAGMTYIEKAAGSLYAPKILGCYEQELQPYFADLSRYKRFVDVGCAEGYYAVGALRGSPGLEVIGFDISPKARQACALLAEANGVGDRLKLGEACDGAMLGELCEPGTLVLMDIEGAEVDLLRSVPRERLALADLIVETHYNVEAPDREVLTLEALIALLSDTHDITIVDQRERSWGAFPEMAALSQLDRFLAQWEGRGSEPWIVCRARR